MWTAAVLAGLAGLLAGVVADSSLPAEAFVLHTARWQFKNGDPPDADVISTSAEQADCACMTKCLVNEECLSYCYDSTDQNCTIFNVRGNVESHRRPTSRGVHFRQGMAYLGDWCSTDQDCSLLTSGVASCKKSTCSCPSGEFPQNKTTCGRAATSEPTTSTTAEITASATSESITPTTSGNDTPTTTESTTSTTAESTTSTTTGSTSTTAESTSTTTGSTTSSSTESATSTITTTAASTTPEATTTSATSTTAASTTAAPSVEFTSINQDDDQNRLAQKKYTMDCALNPSENRVMVAMMNEPRDENAGSDIDAVRCAKFLHLPDLVIGTKDEKIDMDEPPLSCNPGSILVTLEDDRSSFYFPEGIFCAAVEPPYAVDNEDCADVTISDPSTDLAMDPAHTGDWPFQCPQLPEATGIVHLEYKRGFGNKWFGMRCCRIKLTP